MHQLLLIIIYAHTVFANVANTEIKTIFKKVTKTSDISVQCNNSLNLYEQNLNEFPPDDLWALKMLDATSKIPTGFIFSYNFGEMGNFVQCLETESKDKSIKGKYCLGNIAITTYENTLKAVPDILQDLKSQIFLKNISGVLANLPAKEISSMASPTWAVCLPSDCSDTDVLELFNLKLKNISELEFSSFVCQTKEDTLPPLSNGAIVTIVILSIISSVMVLSTSYDLYCSKKEIEPVHILLVAFSTYSNGKKLFKINKNSSEISCLNGIKVLSMMWVIVLHTFSLFTSGPVSNMKSHVDWANSIESMIIVNGTLAVDTFLVAGGALLVYTYMKGIFHGAKFNLFHFYIHRYLRLTPPLAAVVLVSATLLEYMGSGPKWNYILDNFQDNCVQYWWSTLLYIQNYVNVSKMCVGQSWYLNIDTQLYLISPIILIILSRYNRIGVLVILTGIVLSIFASFYIAFTKELAGVTSNIYAKTPSDVYMNYYYLKTHTRAAPWLIGLLLGYGLAFVKFNNFKAHKIGKNKAIIIWIICLCVIMTCLLGGHSTLRQPEYDRYGNSFYIAFVRPVWGLCVAWIIWACAIGYGGPINSLLSLPIFQILNRFTYSMYLLHVTMLFIIVFSAKSSIYFTPFNMAYLFWGIYMFTFGLSLLWVLAFESPVIIIEKLIFKSKK